MKINNKEINIDEVTSYLNHDITHKNYNGLYLNDNQINILNENFSVQLPLSPLHWIISDKERSITLESVKSGIKIYENPVGVLTNNPTFPEQLFNLNNYMNLSVKTPENTFSKDLELDTYSRGMGAIGLPGDLSSSSRFAKVLN